MASGTSAWLLLHRQSRIRCRLLHRLPKGNFPCGLTVSYRSHRTKQQSKDNSLKKVRRWFQPMEYTPWSIHCNPWKSGGVPRCSFLLSTVFYHPGYVEVHGNYCTITLLLNWIISLHSRNNSAYHNWERCRSEISHFGPNPGVLISDNDYKTQGMAAYMCCGESKPSGTKRQVWDTLCLQRTSTGFKSCVRQLECCWDFESPFRCTLAWQQDLNIRSMTSLTTMTSYKKLQRG